MEKLASRATDGKSRDGVIEAARAKLFEDAMMKGNHELLLELYRAANEERAREREVAVAQRKAAVAEENAKIGWRRLELDRARAAMKLLPRLRAILVEGNGPAEERLAMARDCFMDGEVRLLKETGQSEVAQEVVGAQEEKTGRGNQILE